VNAAATPDTAIRVSGVSKTFRIYRERESTLKETILRRRRGIYEEFTAVDDVSFTVPTGEALGIFGRNGSGKSTILKMLARILTPDRGAIEVKGRVAALLEVGAGFHPEYSAVENIFLSGAIYGMSREQLAARVDDIIAFSQLERFADNPVKTYSSGMYARLGFAIAVNVDPDVLLVDEVLAVGDESFRSRCYERMLAFREAGKTLILVTHDLGAIASFCSRAIWLDEGRVRGEDTPEAITRRYVAEVTAQEELWSAQQAAAGRGLVTFHQPINDTVPISLTSMSIAAEDGTERDVFHNGEAIRVRVHYTAQKPVRSPIVEIALHRHDGTHVTTASTRTGRFDPGDVLEGEGFIEWEIEDVRVTPGSYYLSPKLIDQTGLHVLDEQERWYRFQVRAGDYLETEGAAILPASWSHVRTRDGAPPTADVVHSPAAPASRPLERSESPVDV
jgi:ABC-type polysaccharide/polyol phosphate transport system ATPase subunit